MEPKLAAIGANHLSASPRNNTYQLPQFSPGIETPIPLQDRKIKIPVSPRKSLRDPDRSPWIPKPPEGDVSQSTPSSEPPHDTHSGDGLPDHGGRAILDGHRFEAAATLTRLLCLPFFENTKTPSEQISRLITLWSNTREDNACITKTPESVGAKGIPTQIEKIKPKSVGVAVLQSLDQERKPNSNKKSLVKGDQNVPKTPESHGSKRKSSNLSPPFNAQVPQSSDSEAIKSKFYRLNLGVPPVFNLNNSSQSSPPSPTESRRVRSYVRGITSETDMRPAKLAKPNHAGRNPELSLSDDNLAAKSVGLQGSPNITQGNKHDEKDDLYDPFARSEYVTMIFTRDAISPAGIQNAKSSFSDIRADGISAQNSKGSLSHNDRPIGRKLAPYAKRPPRSLAPETIMCEAIISPLTKYEKGIGWSKTSSTGVWIQQTTHRGWIYIYQLPNEVNTVKIGITQVSIEGRLDSWAEQCGHKPQIAYPSTEAEREPVPNIYRLEALVQAELAATRLEELKCSCGKKHIEWFEEALAHARKVVVKWSNWMRTNPYREVVPEQWHLLPRYIPDLAELSRPSPRDPVEGSVSTYSERLRSFRDYILIESIASMVFDISWKSRGAIA